MCGGILSLSLAALSLAALSPLGLYTLVYTSLDHHHLERERERE
jgi:hypothetical protein